MAMNDLARGDVIGGLCCAACSSVMMVVTDLAQRVTAL